MFSEALIDFFLLININRKVSQIYCGRLYFSHINCRPFGAPKIFMGFPLIWNQVWLAKYVRTSTSIESLWVFWKVWLSLKFLLLTVHTTLSEECI